MYLICRSQIEEYAVVLQTERVFIYMVVQTEYMFVYIYIYIYILVQIEHVLYIQGVTGGTDQTSRGCSLC
jgi:hypothetical protein